MRKNNLESIKESRKSRFNNRLKLQTDKKKTNGQFCGTVNPYTSLNIPLPGFGYLDIACYNDDHSSNASGIVSPGSIQITTNSSNPFKTTPGIYVYLSTFPIVQIINHSGSVSNYFITLSDCKN